MSPSLRRLALVSIWIVAVGGCDQLLGDFSVGQGDGGIDASSPPDGGGQPDGGGPEAGDGSSGDASLRDGEMPDGTIRAGDSGDAAQAGEAGEAGDASVPVVDCTTYCNLIRAACGAPPSPYAQYATQQECMTTCQYIPLGDGGTASGNTLLCHYEHAINALGTDAGVDGVVGRGLGANPHCWHAGPYGFGVCGGECEDFCNIVTNYCTPAGGFDSGPPPYASSTDCLAACAMFAGIADAGGSVVMVDGSPNTSSYTANGPTSGDTRDCREYHLGAALYSTTNQQLHCNHPSVTSATCR